MRLLNIFVVLVSAILRGPESFGGQSRQFSPLPEKPLKCHVYISDGREYENIHFPLPWYFIDDRNDKEATVTYPYFHPLRSRLMKNLVIYPMLYVRATSNAGNQEFLSPYQTFHVLFDRHKKSPILAEAQNMFPHQKIQNDAFKSHKIPLLGWTGLIQEGPHKYQKYSIVFGCQNQF